MRSPPGKGSTALPGVHKVWKPLAGGRWARIWYAWRGGGPQIARFEGASKAEIIAQESSVAGAARVAEGYAAASAPRVDTTTLAGILTAWEASDAFKRRSDSTKRVERRAAEAIRVSRIGSLPARALPVQRTKKIVRDWLGEVATANGPRAADTRKDVLSKALNWGKREGLCAGNPAEGIADYHFSDRSDIIWTAADIAAFEAAARSGAGEDPPRGCAGAKRTAAGRAGALAGLLHGAALRRPVRPRLARRGAKRHHRAPAEGCAAA